PCATRESATANGMAPPPATRPIGDEMSKALSVMALAAPPSGSVAVVSRHAKRPMLGFADEGQNLCDGRIFVCQRLHRGKPFREHARSVKQLLIERAHRGKPLARKLPSFHADDIEAFETGILAVDETERDHVAAHAADHRLRSDPGQLVHGRQPSNIDEVADLAVTSERSRSGKDHIIADLA